MPGRYQMLVRWSHHHLNSKFIISMGGWFKIRQGGSLNYYSYWHWNSKALLVICYTIVVQCTTMMYLSYNSAIVSWEGLNMSLKGRAVKHFYTEACYCLWHPKAGNYVFTPVRPSVCLCAILCTDNLRHCWSKFVMNCLHTPIRPKCLTDLMVGAITAWITFWLV